MRSFCRHFVLCCLLGATALGDAQVLARPGWAGSGVSSEPWWRRAVFYRIGPSTFQDSDGDGQGDVAGIEQRLGYIQQLGVDAIVLRPPYTPDEFGDLARKAGDFHLRVLAQMDSADPVLARTWLNQGAAGVVVDASRASEAQMSALRSLVQNGPGERVLVALGVNTSAAPLSLAAELNTAAADAVTLRSKLSASVGSKELSNQNLLLALSGVAKMEGDADQQAIDDRALSAALLASRSAAIFDAGRELGLRSKDGSAVAMQWTPTNLTREKATPEVAAVKPKVEVYGAFTPYIRPPKLMLPAPVTPKVVESDSLALVDPNTLPGFTSGELKEPVSASGTAENVFTEDIDQASLLNFYRHLIALHHGNGSLRNGAQVVFDRDAQGVTLWLRRAPSGSQTVGSVLVALNDTDKPVELDLSKDFAAQKMRGGLFRPLLTASTAKSGAAGGDEGVSERVDKLTLPPRTIFLGEVGRGAEAATETSSPRRQHKLH
ncbi:MAG: hypothetical protein PW735_11830 [Acidobacteriaceae bacterium]|nr:hypothetical protein [Acidobacteriaceae bacterium]